MSVLGNGSFSIYSPGFHRVQQAADAVQKTVGAVQKAADTVQKTVGAVQKAADTVQKAAGAVQKNLVRWFPHALTTSQAILSGVAGYAVVEGTRAWEEGDYQGAFAATVCGAVALGCCYDLPYRRDPSIKNRDGYTVLMEAAEEDGASVYNPPILDTLFGEAGIAENARVVRELIEVGADVDAADINGSTALMKAAEKGRRAAIVALLEGGADVHRSDRRGVTALMVVQQESRQFLIDTFKSYVKTAVEASDFYSHASDARHQIPRKLLELVVGYAVEEDATLPGPLAPLQPIDRTLPYDPTRRLGSLHLKFSSGLNWRAYSYQIKKCMQMFIVAVLTIRLTMPDVRIEDVLVQNGPMPNSYTSPVLTTAVFLPLARIVKWYRDTPSVPCRSPIVAQGLVEAMGSIAAIYMVLVMAYFLKTPTVGLTSDL